MGIQVHMLWWANRSSGGSEVAGGADCREMAEVGFLSALAQIFSVVADAVRLVALRGPYDDEIDVAVSSHTQHASLATRVLPGDVGGCRRSDAAALNVVVPRPVESAANGGAGSHGDKRRGREAIGRLLWPANDFSGSSRCSEEPCDEKEKSHWKHRQHSTNPLGLRDVMDVRTDRLRRSKLAQTSGTGEGE